MTIRVSCIVNQRTGVKHDELFGRCFEAMSHFGSLLSMKRVRGLTLAPIALGYRMAPRLSGSFLEGLRLSGICCK